MKNVILLTIDALRKDMFGCYGNPDSRTPFMDSIQPHCIRFSNAQATAPYTQASFPGILTSTYYLDYGRCPNLPAQTTLISEVVKQRGIATAAFHSNPYLSDDLGYNRGWDTFYDSMQEQVTEMYPFIGGKAISLKIRMWIHAHLKNQPDRPFFVWGHYMDVHEPYIPRVDYLEHVDPGLDIAKSEMLQLFKDVLLPRDVSNKEVVEVLRKLYHAKVLEVDNHIKELFGAFDHLGILKNTIIIIGADHGDEFGEHGGLSHDGKMYSELVNVPLFIYDQNRTENLETDILVSNLDISPTIVQLFEIGNVSTFRGRSLLPLEKSRRKNCFGEAIGKLGNTEHDSDQPVSFYCEKDKKVIYNENTGNWELYDLENDPHETTNMFYTSPLGQTMRNKLTARINR